MAEPTFEQVTELATKLARYFDPQGTMHETVDRNYARAVLSLGYVPSSEVNNA